MGVKLRTKELEVTCFPEHGFVIGSITSRPVGNVLWNPPGATFAPLGWDLGPPGDASVTSFDKDVLAGGWFLMFPSAGPPGPGYDGWMHGEAARLPWSMVSNDETHVRAQLETPISGFLLDRQVTLDGSVLRVETVAENVSGKIRSITFGEHPCLRRDVFAGGRIEMRPSAAFVYSQADPEHASLAGEQVFSWPIAPEVDGDWCDLASVPVEPDGRHDHVGLTLPSGTVDILDADGATGLRLTWDTKTMSYALLWQHFLPGSSPWPGDVLAIEPSSSDGRTRSESVEQGHERQVGIGERVRTWMAIEVLDRRAT